MKDAEIQFLINNIDLPPRQKKYYLKKWQKKGWWEGSLTNKGEKVKELIINKDLYTDLLDGHVVICTFKNEPKMIGILEDHGDNGLYFYSKNTYFYVRSRDIAYLEQHPNPKDYWRRINYAYYRHSKFVDRFHKKIREGDYSTHLVKTDNGFEWFNPNGKIGECYSFCQCKSL